MENEKKHLSSRVKPGILFVYMDLSTFVEQDLQLLKKHYDVIPYRYTEKTARMVFVKWLIQNRGRFDIIYVWFGDLHATISVLMAKLLRKKSIIIVGGYDTKYIPEIKYGFLSKPRRYLFAWFHFTFADKVVTVDDSLKANIMQNVKTGGKNIITIMTSPDSEFWLCKKEKTSNAAITVGKISNNSVAKLKGITTLIEAAKLLPSVKFEIIGVQEKALSELKSISPPNVIIYPILDKTDLLRHYQDAKVYLQLSLSEGLGNALCEAMLCECVPVGTNIGGIPTAIGNIGFYVPYGDEKATADAIKKAMMSKMGKLARERIKSLMSPQMRERIIVGLLDSIVHKDATGA